MKRLAFVLLASCGGDPADPLVVQLDSGAVRGVADDGAHRWLGIPYAAPPVDALRWQPPAPVTPWTGVREARAFGANCAQTETFLGGAGDEDCLYLNVWAPEQASGAPVLVWLHGGAFVAGSGAETYYDGSVLAAEGTVVVTVNYRLGALGFLAHPDGITGNYGLHDQRAALAWVQRNIAGFGGDPSRVVLVGESAGGASTCIHYLAAGTEDLFAAAVSQSGVCSTGFPEPTLADGEAIGEEIAAMLGCEDAACLRALPAEELVAVLALPPSAEQLPGGPFYQDGVGVGPLVDGDVYAVGMGPAFAAGDYARRPLILGTNRDEGEFFHNPLTANDVEDEAEYRAALAVRYPDDVDAIVAMYPVADFENADEALTRVTTDAGFVCPARRTARAAAAAGADVYLYSFERAPDGAAIDGVFHGAEIPFVFGVEVSFVGRIDEPALPLSAAMRRYWTSLADGAPTGDIAWPAYDDSDPHLVLDVPITTGTAHRAAICDFWDAL